MGIEHSQTDAIESIFRTNKVDPKLDSQLYTQIGKKTPNQRALACGLGLGFYRLTGPATGLKQVVQDSIALFDAMAVSGHQAVGSNYGNEQLCCDPHAELWNAAIGSILREARLQNLDTLIKKCIQYYADHFNVIKNFWSPQGVRIAGSRAKNPGGIPLKPNWSVDSWMYALINGMSTKPLLHPNRLTIDIFQDNSSVWPQIKSQMSITKPFLNIPVRKWNTNDGGFITALSYQTPLNDPLAYVYVNGAGDITQASHVLSDFVDPGRAPDLVYGH